MGPICSNKKLAPFLPGHTFLGSSSAGVLKADSTGYAVQSAPFGQAGIAAIPWMFISLLGENGIKKSAEVAILNANYMKERLKGHYDIKRGNKKHDRCSHEFIVDVARLKQSCGITEEDIAKRLQDYGFHAPTMSWPVHYSLMIEPTESEDQPELDRFCDALISIRKEIAKIESGQWDLNDNPLKNAPHPQERVVANGWDHCYTREEAAFPLPYIRERGKFWPTVGRVSNAYGDRNIKVKHES
jgi:glycine dehydrogenase